jgi:hypothetical protein
MGEMRNTCKILVGNLEEKSPLRRLVEDGKTILEWTLQNSVWGWVLSGCIWLRIRRDH